MHYLQAKMHIENSSDWVLDNGAIYYQTDAQWAKTALMCVKAVIRLLHAVVHKYIALCTHEQ